MNTHRRLSATLALAGVISAALSYAPIARAADAPATDARAAAGKAIYLDKCSQCHGTGGEGKGDGAEFFRPLPRDFTSGSFKIRTTESGESPTDADLKSIIRSGMPYTGMPAWPEFSEEELGDLVAFIKGFNSDFADTANHPKPIAAVKPPAFSKESAERGSKLFVENKCMDCHGKLGRGDGESAPTLNDDWGHAIRPADLTRRWTFRGGPRREDIFRTIMTGLNGTPMPSYTASIEEKDRWALVDYIHSLSPGDEPGYASLVTAEAVPGELGSKPGRDAFTRAKPALFPVVGQVIEARRDFFPAANAVEVRAVYDSDYVSVLVSWHDMSAQRKGANSPIDAAGSDSGAVFSDAIAIQIPGKAIEGAGKPYFLSGDKRNPAELWFRDLGTDTGEVYAAKGAGNLARIPGTISVDAGYADGEWWAVFTRKRSEPGRYAFEPGGFAPIAFSVWDGLSRETGSSRGVTSWFTLYLKPARAENPLAPASKRAALAIVLEAGLIWFLRRRAAASKR
ncbi:MAG: c-type cytochrome [Fibrobacteria bacterium]